MSGLGAGLSARICSSVQLAALLVPPLLVTDKQAPGNLA